MKIGDRIRLKPKTWVAVKDMVLRNYGARVNDFIITDININIGLVSVNAGFNCSLINVELYNPLDLIKLTAAERAILEELNDEGSPSKQELNPKQ